MNKQISKSQFKAKALELFREIETSGESVIVTDHGRPAIEIRPYRTSSDQAWEMLKGSVLHYEDPFEPVGLEDWEALP